MTTTTTTDNRRGKTQDVLIEIVYDQQLNCYKPMQLQCVDGVWQPRQAIAFANSSTVFFKTRHDAKYMGYMRCAKDYFVMWQDTGNRDYLQLSHDLWFEAQTTLNTTFQTGNHISDMRSYD